MSSWWAHPVPEDGYFGWSGPFSTGAYGSSLAMTFDDEPDPKGE